MFWIITPRSRRRAASKVTPNHRPNPNNLSSPVSKQPNGFTCESYGSQLHEICSVGGRRSHKGPPRRRRAASEVSSNHQPNPTTSPPRSQSNRMGSLVKVMGHSCRKSAVLVVVEVTKGHRDDAAQPQRTNHLHNKNPPYDSPSLERSRLFSISLFIS